VSPLRSISDLGLAIVLAQGISAPAWAVRPFVTDDARSVGARQAQVESWLQLDGGSLNHWILASIGPAAPVELAVGISYGADWSEDGARFTLPGPLLQAKFVLIEPRKNRWPGVALEAGTLVPLGYDDSTQEGWRSFALVALTESLFEDERLLIHGNLGVFHAGDFRLHGRDVEFIWGLGAQLRTFAGLHVVAEIFSGDPYSGASGGAVQGGLRYMFNKKFQMDATVGTGLWGDNMMGTFGTAGVRIVGGPFGGGKAD
jgi:hypothetical protein